MKFIMVLPNQSFDMYMYSDILERENVVLYNPDKIIDNKVKDSIRRIHTSLRINSVIDLPYRYIYYDELESIVSDGDCVIFQHVCAGKIGKKFLDKLKNNHANLKFVLLLVDSMSAHSITLHRAWKIIGNYKWDIILSYDINDCDKYGFTHIGYSYYSMLKNINITKHYNDIYYVGINKKNDGRMEILKSICYKFKEDDIDSKILVRDLKANSADIEKSKVLGISIYKKNIDYPNIISDVLSSNCILEILQDGQKVQTVRYMEAVCYNKKLLTNNPNIVDYPYYDSRYMKVFSKPEDIDIEWIKRRENIDYGYKGDFSPVRILDIIEEKLAR